MQGVERVLGPTPVIQYSPALRNRCRRESYKGMPKGRCEYDGQPLGFSSLLLHGSEIAGDGQHVLLPVHLRPFMRT